jgi:transcriptional regulator with XRE-family HTH domain
MTLLRRVLGEALRGQRLRQRRTLREVSGAARVSLGYLSEVERGQKEASSELLASICDALDVRMSDLLREVSDTMRRGERAGELARMPARTLQPAGVGAPRPVPPSRRPAADTPGFQVDRAAFESDRVERAAAPADTADSESAPRVPVAVDVTAHAVAPRGSADLPVLPVPEPGTATPEPAERVSAELVPARFERFGRDVAELDGIELGELESGDELGEVEVLLSLTDLLCRPDGSFGPHPMRGELAAAGAGVVA